MISDTKIEVRYAETDQMGVVYHANYLIWFEVARTEFLKEIGQPYEKFEEQGIFSPVINAELAYGTPLRYGDEIIVRTKLTALSAVRCIYAYEVYRADQNIGVDKPSCTGHTTHCFVRKNDFKPINMKKYTPELYEVYSRILESA